jgi:hypothetical protein
VKFERIVILDSIYKTNYSTTDTGSLLSAEGQLVIKYYKTSFVEKDALLAQFIGKYQPAGVLNIMSGFGAGILVESEIRGISAAVFKLVTDSHYVSTETLQGFQPIVSSLLGA